MLKQVDKTLILPFSTLHFVSYLEKKRTASVHVGIGNVRLQEANISNNRKFSGVSKLPSHSSHLINCKMMLPRPRFSKHFQFFSVHVHNALQKSHDKNR